MAIAKKKFREGVFQAVYAAGLGAGEVSTLLKEKGKLPSGAVKEIVAYAEKVEKEFEKLDAMIDEVSSHEKIGEIERNILRLAVYELFYDRETPGEVVIAEAMRLTQKFGTEASSKYVNAILDTLFKKASS